MSTLVEIEDAIEKLPSDEVEKLARWLDGYQATIAASAETFAALDAEEDDSESQWLGD
tara:strand:- start:2233 stop:2406 length:174 start_codon:yes stop_codon:yes gene_type:complete